MSEAIGLLKEMHQREHGIMTGSGTSALVLALWALGLHGKRIAIPCGVCYSVPLAVYLSGNEPVYLDIDRETLSLSEGELYRNQGKPKPKLLTVPSIGIVGVRYPTEPAQFDAAIAVHNYGARCDIEGIAEFCTKAGLSLIEDCCVALGAEDIGHWGDLSVFSFGRGKILDAQYGGAVLSDDKSMVAEMELMQKVMARHNFTESYRASSHLSGFHTRLYNRYYGTDKRRLAIFGRVARTLGFDGLWFPEVWFYDKPGYYEEQLCEKLSGLRENVFRRRHGWDDLWIKLAQCFDIFQPPIGSVDWRFNFFVPERRDELMRHLHAKGYKASSWHPPADIFFREREGPSTTPVADEIGNTILNLWVDDAYVDGVSEEILRWLEEK